MFFLKKGGFFSLKEFERVWGCEGVWVCVDEGEGEGGRERALILVLMFGFFGPVCAKRGGLGTVCA